MVLRGRKVHRVALVQLDHRVQLVQLEHKVILDLSVHPDLLEILVQKDHKDQKDLLEILGPKVK
jgi:Zn-finger domain-containing protein